MARMTISLLLAGLASSASAQNIIGPAFSVTATNGTGTATFEVDPANDGLFLAGQGLYLWSFAQFVPGGTIELRDDNTNALVAVLTNGVVSIQDGSTGENPVIGIAFAVAAGSTDTTFRIDSGLVDVADLAMPAARASSGFTLTDANGDGNASLTGGLDDGFMFEALANGSRFAALQTGLLVNTADGSTAENADFPNGDGVFGPVGAPLLDARTAVEFTLSAFDTASGTSAFGAFNIPAPASVVLLVMGGALAARRR